MADFHIHAHSECNANDKHPQKKVLQITWREGSTCSVAFDQAGFRHLHPELIKQAAHYEKVTLVHPETHQKRVLKDNGTSVEPYIEDQ